MMGRRGRRHKQLLDDLKEKKGYGKLKRKQYIALCGELSLEEAIVGQHNVEFLDRKWEDKRLD
jgi:hypothetical protein